MSNWTNEEGVTYYKKFTKYSKFKVDVKSVLRIGSAHNKRGHADLKNRSKFRIFRTFSELKLWFIFVYEHVTNQNSDRFSVSIIFYKFRRSKCIRNQSVCLHYGLDIHFNLLCSVLNKIKKRAKCLSEPAVFSGCRRNFM